MPETSEHDETHFPTILLSTRLSAHWMQCVPQKLTNPVAQVRPGKKVLDVVYFILHWDTSSVVTHNRKCDRQLKPPLHSRESSTNQLEQLSTLVSQVTWWQGECIWWWPSSQKDSFTFPEVYHLIQRHWTLAIVLVTSLLDSNDQLKMPNLPLQTFLSLSTI